MAGFAPALTAAGTQQCALYFIPSRIEPTMPPTAPPCTNFDRHDMPGQFRGEGNPSSGADGPVLRHEPGSASRHALQHAEDSSAPTKLGVRRHLDGTGHPGKLTGFRNDGFVGVKREFKDRHGGAEDATLHGGLLVWIARCRRFLARAQRSFAFCHRPFGRYLNGILT